ncbi:hypothetical protein [Streptomyces corynorhini]|uniref:DUF3618 domain-containing protein n=1 Tax=Streptomyces corynorhini TaxID=2282652 RepID=A0A370BD78_9ACTN|nr:hypothetical protein [Streptomyces corynorhini]RDG37753.1 hypothetical protein DVH02_12825 [Streptomyces corynorhini]
MNTDPAHPAVADAELRRSLDVGQARTDGRMALLAQRIDQTDKDVTDLAVRVAALEHARWPLPAVASLCTIGALATTVWQAVGH